MNRGDATDFDMLGLIGENDREYDGDAGKGDFDMAVRDCGTNGLMSAYRLEPGCIGEFSKQLTLNELLELVGA
jgi:hypothetical protein